MSLTRTLLKFNAYIQGGETSSEVLKAYMAYYDKELEQLKTDLYSTTIDAIAKDAEACAAIDGILISLRIPKEQWSGYLNSQLSVYDFFIKLKHERHYQADYILSLIEEKTSTATIKFIIRCLISGAVAGGSAVLPTVAGILGMISTSGFALSYLYDSQYDAKKTDEIRFRDDSFILANAFFNLSAYAVWAANELSPAVNSLFVAASVVSTLKELLCVTENWLDDKKLPQYTQDLGGNQEFLRRKYQELQERNERMINATISVNLTGVMAVWCFVPGGVVLSVAAVATNIGLAIIKHCLLKNNEIAMRTALQTELNTVKEAFETEGVDEDIEITTTQGEATQVNRYSFHFVPMPLPVVQEINDDTCLIMTTSSLYN